MEMRHLTIAGLAISAMGAAAFGASPFMEIDRTNMPIYSAADIGLQAVDMATGEIVYSNLGATPRDNFKTTYSSMFDGFEFAITSAVGGAIFDDYAKIGFGARTGQALNNIRFAGGVALAGDVGFFDFFDTDGNPVDGFGVAFPQGGDLIWTIDLKAGPGEEPIIKADAGFLQLSGGENNAITWFSANGTAGLIGSNLGVAGDGSATGDFADTVYAFELNNVPTPGALALFGLAGLASARRRRA